MWMFKTFVRNHFGWEATELSGKSRGPFCRADSTPPAVWVPGPTLTSRANMCRLGEPALYLLPLAAFSQAPGRNFPLVVPRI